MKRTLILVFLLLTYGKVWAATDTLVIHESDIRLLKNNFFTQLEDPDKNLTFKQVMHRTDFVRCPALLPSLRLSNQVVWLKTVLKNKSTQPNIPITIGSVVIDGFDIYYIGGNKQPIHLKPQPVLSANYLSPKETIINCPLFPDSVQTVFIRIQSNSPNIMPLEFYSANKYQQSYNTKNTGLGIFTGIVLIMILYNLFLFFIVKDKSYLYYVVYVISLSVSQGLTHGYGLYLTDAALMNNYIVPLIRVAFWLSILLFINEYLQIRKEHKKFYRYYRFLFLLSALPLLAIITGYTNFAYSLITLHVVIDSVSLLIVGIWLYADGAKHAKFFMVAWSLFLISVLISVARNKGFLPYNNFTANVLLFGAVVEMVLFSVALADKINFYRDQNTEAQTLALHIARENEKLTTEQNIQLENKVLGRTRELLESNQNLTGLVTNLKATQAQLIETEKMASLGQLTAGIAHEINNPINFVKSNVKPLRLDFNDLLNLLDEYAAIEKQADGPHVFKAAADLKQTIDLDFVKNEITDLLNGIEEGAARTAEIIQSLRDFSRTDEVELKPADINKSILSSLILLRNIIPYYIEITPVFDKLPAINCYPGKLNQVFINLIHNSIQAINEKATHQKESILIATKNHPDKITIEITDTGIGMDDGVRQKMFDPFFTTKGVGEGTGLGLSIVFGIIEKHNGSIEVKSARGKGTSIVIMLPKTLS